MHAFDVMVGACNRECAWLTLYVSLRVADFVREFELTKMTSF